MNTTTLDFNTIALMVMIAGSWLTIVGLIVHQVSRLDTKFDTKIDALDTKFTGKLDVMGRDVVDVRERLARVEGHLMGPRSPGVSDVDAAAAGGPPPEDPDAGRSQAV